MVERAVAVNDVEVPLPIASGEALYTGHGINGHRNFNMSKTRSSSSNSWRWMILLAKASLSFFSLGLYKSMGVFIPYVVEDLHTTVTAVGAAASIYGGLCSVLAPVASAMTPCGPRTLVVVGGAVMSISTMVAATSSSVILFTLWMALASVGEAFVLVSALKPLMDYFPDTFATASGIAFAFGTVGMMALPPLAEWLIQLFGWRSALFLLGAINLNLCVSGALLRPHSTAHHRSGLSYRKLRREDEIGARESSAPDEDAERSGIGAKCTRLFGSLRDRLDVTLLVDEPRLMLQLLAFFMVSAVYGGWQLFLVPHAVALGYGGQLSSFLSTFGGLGSLVGRVANGFLTDRGLVTPVNLLVLASILCAASSLVDPLATSSFAALSVLATLTGVGIGFTYPLTFVILRTNIDEDRLMAAFGWLYLFLGGGLIFGGYLSGWVYDASGDYEMVFIMYGGLSLAALPLMISSRLAGRCSS